MAGGRGEHGGTGTAVVPVDRLRSSGGFSLDLKELLAIWVVSLKELHLLNGETNSSKLEVSAVEMVPPETLCRRTLLIPGSSTTVLTPDPWEHPSLLHLTITRRVRTPSPLAVSWSLGRHLAGPPRELNGAIFRGE